MNAMPEEANAAPAKGGFSKKLIIVIVIAVVAGLGGGFGVMKVMKKGDAHAEEKKSEAEEAVESHKPAESEAIPATAVVFDFADGTANVLPDKGAQASGSSILQYAVSMVCSNEECKVLLEKNKQIFAAMLGELHRFRTKSELNDPVVQKNILKQALQESNSLVKRLQEKPNEEIRILQVLHVKYAVFDL
jgi:flagellar basal body-associated protein FliL